MKYEKLADKIISQLLHNAELCNQFENYKTCLSMPNTWLRMFTESLGTVLEKELTNYLKKTGDYNPDNVHVMIGDKKISGYARSENIIDNTKNKIIVKVDNKEIIGPCTVSIFTKKTEE